MYTDMTEIVSDERWTTERLVDELFIHLDSFTKVIKNEQGKTLTVKKYHRQAYELLPRIPVAKPTPTFIINTSDLTPRLLRAQR
jgi:hypothetical protein